MENQQIHDEVVITIQSINLVGHTGEKMSTFYLLRFNFVVKKSRTWNHSLDVQESTFFKHNILLTDIFNYHINYHYYEAHLLIKMQEKSMPQSLDLDRNVK